MEDLKSKVGWILSLMMIMLHVADARQPVLHRVGGGSLTWAPNINFTDWSIKEIFYVGDWLYFGFDKQIYNVLEVNKTSYEKCIDKGYIFNVTRGGKDVFNLTETRTYFFLSGRGFCSKGMKVAVSVQQTPPEQLLLSSGFKSYPYARITILGMIASWAFHSNVM